MNKKRYMISDASKKLEVEPHVLRYWEDELRMEIQRNEMGHRFYTETDIKILECVKKLKQQGFQLKAIKLLMPELLESKGTKVEELFSRKEELNLRAEQEEEQKGAVTVLEQGEVVQEDPLEKKMDQFQNTMNKIVANALLDNNELLGQAISDYVTDRVLKEMDYQFRVREEQEEQRFKKIDEIIRTRQQTRLETASALEQPRKKMRRRKKRFFLR